MTLRKSLLCRAYLNCPPLDRVSPAPLSPVSYGWRGLHSSNAIAEPTFAFWLASPTDRASLSEMSSHFFDLNDPVRACKALVIAWRTVEHALPDAQEGDRSILVHIIARLSPITDGRAALLARRALREYENQLMFELPRTVMPRYRRRHGLMRM